MARAIWSGVLSFGLEAIPVELYSVTEPHRPAFRQFEEGTADRIRYERVNERTGEEVGHAGIHTFVGLDETDAIYFGKT